MDKKAHHLPRRFRKSLILFCDKIAAICHVIAAFAVFFMLTLVTVQVISRYIFNAPLGWTQELSVFSLMLAVMAGMAVAFWRGDHFRVSIFVDSLPSMISNVVIIASRLITIIFLSVVVWYSYALAMRAMSQTSPTTGIPIGYIQLFLTSGCLIASFLLIVKTLLGHNTQREESANDTEKAQ